jgi:hypothetical protein
MRLAERTNTNPKQWKQLCVINQFKDANENPKVQQGEASDKESA